MAFFSVSERSFLLRMFLNDGPDADSIFEVLTARTWINEAPRLDTALFAMQARIKGPKDMTTYTKKTARLPIGTNPVYNGGLSQFYLSCSTLINGYKSILIDSRMNEIYHVET